MSDLNRDTQTWIESIEGRVADAAQAAADAASAASAAMDAATAAQSAPLQPNTYLGLSALSSNPIESGSSGLWLDDSGSLHLTLANGTSYTLSVTEYGP
jgi:hypothetical protein